MTEEGPTTTDSPRGRGRGKSKSRGGLGKYLRARGRGRGYGRPAEFTKRLVLEGEEQVELDPEEAEELQRKYGRRQLGSNADRYVEPEPELGSDGEEIKEPEVDLAAFLERQRTSEPTRFSPATLDNDDDDIDHDLDHITSSRQVLTRPKKGNIRTIAWDKELGEMKLEKDAAEAVRDLKARFRAKTGRLRETPASIRQCAQVSTLTAPPLRVGQAKAPKEEMQDYLDELLS
ncbi:hypothetical protein ID866_10341 [Astraeus odoratus]|nr:hypothetical protein ID866_10341 [Astraeus odoratus]